MVHPSKNKGNGYERELVNAAKDAGLDSKRAYASDGRSLGLHETVDLLIDDKKIQAKRRKSIAAFMKPTEHVDAVAIRQDRGETLIVITLHEYLDLIKRTKDGIR
jgi:Holliday junction resolvase